MKKTKLAFLNNENQVSRVIETDSQQITMVFNAQGRLQFLDGPTDNLDEGVEVIQRIDVKNISSQGLAISGFGNLVPYSTHLTVKKDIESAPEEEDRLPFFIKRTATAEVALVLILILSSWVIGKWFSPDPEQKPVIVEIQKRPVTPKVKTVAVSKTKIRPKKRIRKTRKVTNKKVKRSSTRRISRKPSKRVRVVSRKAKVKNVNRMGSLGVVAGFSKKAGRLGQSRYQAKNNSKVYGTGKSSSKGGLARSLTGKGLVASGNGSNSKVKGYSGLGTKGVAGGRKGYGEHRIKGSAGEYFTPLVDESLVVGGLDKDQIHAVVQKNMGQIVYCYEKGLQTKPKLTGRVSVKFVINSSGRIQSAGIQRTSLEEKRVESCIISKLKRWKFPKPVGGVQVRVNYPFILRKLSQG